MGRITRETGRIKKERVPVKVSDGDIDFSGIEADQIWDTSECARVPKATHREVEVERMAELELYCNMAKVVCSKIGAVDTELAALFGVSVSVITAWKNKYPEFKAAILAGKREFDNIVVEECYLRRATGYDYFEETYEYKPVVEDNMVTGYQEVMTKKVKKHVPPDIRAIEGWLSIRNRTEWGLLRIRSAEDQKRLDADNKKLLEEAGTKEPFQLDTSPKGRQAVLNVLRRAGVIKGGLGEKPTDES